MAAARTILVVEDEPDVLEVTSYILEDEGFTVLRAAQAREALGMLRAHAVDLLLTDVVMPGGMNGFDLARTARAAQPTLPVICMTGYIGVDHQPHRDHYDELLPKPFKPRQIVDAVGRALDPARGVRGAAD
jgi:CheY-like chemotaxis protein